MEGHRIARTLRIIPPEGRVDPAFPAPEPPVSGWWLDPTDSHYKRYHDGTRWTDRRIWIRPRHRNLSWSASSLQQSSGAEVPERQGLFPLGAGKEGIPLGGRRAPATARYPGRAAIWVWVGAFCFGFTLFWFGLRSTGASRSPLIVAGATVGIGAVGWLAVLAWRGGFRPPGFGPDTDASRPMGRVALAADVRGGLPRGVADARLDRDSAVYDWLNRVGVILVDSAGLQICLMGLYSSIFMEYDGPPGKEWMRTSNILISLGIGAFMLWVTWDRNLDALWIR